MYSDAVLHQVRFIKQAQSLGLKLEISSNWSRDNSVAVLSAASIVQRARRCSGVIPQSSCSIPILNTI
jgi:hypothetical protein